MESSRMMTSAQPIRVRSPPGVLLPGTLAALKQAPFCRAEDAFGVQARAENASVRNSTGTKIVELKDSISPAKLASTIDDQLPPLLSLIIDGLPPMQQSKYVNEAETRIHQYVKRHRNAMFLDSYCHAGLCSTSYMHAGAISVDRLVAISIQYALMFLVDDLFFDVPSELLQDQYGVSRSVLQSPEKIRDHLDYLNAVFGQQVQPSNPTSLLESMMAELGRDMLELSNPEWFANFVACVVEHHRSSSASHAEIVKGHTPCLQDLESYAVMRAGNVGGKFIQLMVEFANDTYIPSTLRGTPYLENATVAAAIHIGFANDIFSYHRESSMEQNPRNLITLLKELEGEPFVQTVHMAVDLTNAYARTIVDLEAEACKCNLKSHWQDIKSLIAGNVYFSYVNERYRQRDSCFPELRDTNVGWKMAP